LTPQFQDTPTVTGGTVLQLCLEAIIGSGLEVDGDLTCLLTMAKEDDLHGQIITIWLLAVKFVMMNKVSYR
jgi:hypothetical protein